MAQTVPREPRISAPLETAAEQTSNLARMALGVWPDESRSFLEGMTRDGAQALRT